MTLHGTKRKIAVLFVGELHDSGFNACAFQGVERLQKRDDICLEVITGVPFEAQAMTAALTGAANRNDSVIFIGGQGNSVTPPIAKSFPHRDFAVVQGEVIGPNLASYDVLQEQSAFLAGCLAARLTRSGVVGHLSGHRVTPGLKGRAAFVAGVAHMDPSIQVLTGFCGTQDDNCVSQTWAEAEIKAGADVLFTMLNAARNGAITACRNLGAVQIGNVLNWCEIEPDVFIASALARIDRGVEHAALDMIAGNVPDQVCHYGLQDNDIVSLSLAARVPEELAYDIARIGQKIALGEIMIPIDYDGTEFLPES
ncbi:BMP family protein [Pseudorhodobacter sp. W20_MBD10_FR17]|uniref:BMP family protein n=1 Tax=Pseudorhodobacter sp. W20_MBD10_FR17 TaxID=3240266 RepID=UPI003F97C5A6